MSFTVVGIFLCVPLACTIVENAAADGNFTGHKVIRVLPLNHDEVTFIRQLPSLFPQYQFDFWREANTVGQPTDVRISPSGASDFQEELTKRRILHSVFIEDVQKRIDLEREENTKGRDTATGFNYARYNEYHEIVDELKNLTKTHGTITSLLNFGETYEGQIMYGIQIAVEPQVEKEIVFIQCGIHAREWIGPATCMSFLNEILQNRDPHNAYKQVLEKYELVVLPVFNIDGYRYTHNATGNRLWRKTRSPHGGCFGVDANRNWDFKWAGIGSSPQPCSDIYRGEIVSSEIEVINVARYLTSIKSKLASFYDIHSYGQMWLTPWCNTRASPYDYEEIERVAVAGIEALSELYATQYIHGSPADILYSLSGTCIDWTYGYLGVKYSYSLELRDHGQFGFLLPQNQITATGIETTRGIVAAINAMERNL